MQTGVTDGYTIDRLKINDAGVPLLHNLTRYPVRLLSVQWVHKPAAARILNVYAYTCAAIGHGIIGGEGNLPVACPDQYPPDRSARRSFLRTPTRGGSWSSRTPSARPASTT